MTSRATAGSMKSFTGPSSKDKEDSESTESTPKEESEPQTGNDQIFIYWQ